MKSEVQQRWSMSLQIPVRLACQPCGVGWTGIADTVCWSCGGPGDIGGTLSVHRIPK